MQNLHLYFLAVFGTIYAFASNSESFDNLYVRDLSSGDVKLWNNALPARDINEAYKALNIRSGRNPNPNTVCFLLP